MSAIGSNTGGVFTRTSVTADPVRLLEATKTTCQTFIPRVESGVQLKVPEVFEGFGVRVAPSGNEFARRLRIGSPSGSVAETVKVISEFGLPLIVAGAVTTGELPTGTPGVFRKTETTCPGRVLPISETARSRLPSLFQSPAAKAEEKPVGNPFLGPNVPSPRPSSTSREFPSRTATARSGMPSELKSPIFTETGKMPV